MNVKEAQIWGRKLLKEKKVEGPIASSDFLLRQILKVDNTALLAHPERKLNLLEERKYKNWVVQRSKHKPVWYITGKIEFYGQELLVNSNVLIPRPETEVIIETIVKKVKGQKSKVKSPLKVLDIGTGSGAIILSLAKELGPQNEYFASDLSEKALSVAKKNSKKLGHRVNFKKGDLFGPWVGKKFDVIVTNLPYVPHEEMSTLAFDLTHYEPRMALDGGVKGLEIYQRFFEELPGFVNPGAIIYCEIGDKQGYALEKMAQKSFPNAKVCVLKDYADFERVVIVEIPF